jgi:hypothetical protein
MDQPISYYAGVFIGIFVFVLILARITKRMLRGRLPKITGFRRVIIYLSVPVVLGLLLNTSNFIFLIISSLIHGFFMYDENKRKKIINPPR